MTFSGEFNADAPVSRLPQELLLKTASLLEPADLNSCAVVSRGWRHNLITAPTLWTTISIEAGIPGPSLKELLSRTVEADLDVIIDVELNEANWFKLCVDLRSGLDRCVSLGLRSVDQGRLGRPTRRVRYDIQQTSAEIALVLPV